MFFAIEGVQFQHTRMRPLFSGDGGKTKHFQIGFACLDNKSLCEKISKDVIKKCVIPPIDHFNSPNYTRVVEVNKTDLFVYQWHAYFASAK